MSVISLCFAISSYFHTPSKRYTSEISSMIDDHKKREKRAELKFSSFSLDTILKQLLETGPWAGLVQKESSRSEFQFSVLTNFKIQYLKKKYAEILEKIILLIMKNCISRNTRVIYALFSNL